jgi:hypothetical protein
MNQEARSGLQARLTSRLAPAIALALALVAAVAIVATSRGLTAAETNRARALATTALRSFTEELGEQEAPGGSVAAAAREVHDELDGDEVHTEIEPSVGDVARLGEYHPESAAPDERPFGLFAALTSTSKIRIFVRPGRHARRFAARRRPPGCLFGRFTEGVREALRSGRLVL